MRQDTQDFEPREAFQRRVSPWLQACFGAEISADITERNHRFLEEALELVQAKGCTASEAHQLVDYVFGRDVGEPHQEVGGVMVTLAALCLAANLNMHRAGEDELTRVWGKVDQIRAKQAAKPSHSPLPGPSKTDSAAPSDPRIAELESRIAVLVNEADCSEDELFGYENDLSTVAKERDQAQAEVLAMRSTIHEMGCFLQWSSDHELENADKTRLTIDAGKPSSRSLTLGHVLDSSKHLLTSTQDAANTYREQIVREGNPFPNHVTFALGDRLSKKSGSGWHGKVMGFYSTELTPEGYAIESEREQGSVQIYPAKALTKGGEQP